MDNKQQVNAIAARLKASYDVEASFRSTVLDIYLEVLIRIRTYEPPIFNTNMIQMFVAKFRLSCRDLSRSPRAVLMSLDSGIYVIPIYGNKSGSELFRLQM